MPPPRSQIAAVFEFVGALALGSSVVATIAGNIARPDNFAAAPGEGIHLMGAAGVSEVVHYCLVLVLAK